MALASDYRLLGVRAVDVMRSDEEKLCVRCCQTEKSEREELFL